jgi:hypothetical protein
MTRLLPGCALLLLLALPAHAADPAPVADAALGKQLDALDIKYEVDEDADYKMTFELEGGRTQMVFARSPVETTGSHRIREIWSPGLKYSTPELDAKVANRLLQNSGEVIMGGWVRQKSMAMFVVKIPAQATPEQLRDAIEAAAACADAIEQELTSRDEL